MHWLCLHQHEESVRHPPQWIFQKGTRKTCLQPACITWANSQATKHSERSKARRKEANASVQGLMWEECLSKHSGSDVCVLLRLNTAAMNFDDALVQAAGSY